MKKLLEIFLVIGIFVALYYLGNSIIGFLPSIPTYEDIQNSENIVLALTASFVLGLVIGSTSCPVCSLPLIGYIMGAESTAKKAFWASIVFHLGRLATFAMLGGLIVFVGYSAPEGPNFIADGLVGVLMILFSMELFGLVTLSRTLSKKVMSKIQLPYVSVDHPLHLLFWGMLVGVGCGITYIIPMIAVYVGTANQGLIYGFLAVLLFSIATMITPTCLLVLAGGSVEFASKITDSRATKYARYLGGMILLYIGLSYLIAVIISFL